MEKTVGKQTKFECLGRRRRIHPVGSCKAQTHRGQSCDGELITSIGGVSSAQECYNQCDRHGMQFEGQGSPLGLGLGPLPFRLHPCQYLSKPSSRSVHVLQLLLQGANLLAKETHARSSLHLLQPSLHWDGEDLLISKAIFKVLCFYIKSI